MSDIFSEVRFEKIPKMRVARYVIISPNPEDDVIKHMDSWAKESGLLDIPEWPPRKFGWDFPFVSDEQREKHGLRGYVYCYTIPEDFEPKSHAVQITYINEDEYAVLRIMEPFENPFERIPGGWEKLHDYVDKSEYKPTRHDNRYWMEEVVVNSTQTYMDIYYPIR